MSNPSFEIDKNSIEIVKRWGPNLGHLISSTDGDQPQITRNRAALIRHIKSFISSFFCATKINHLELFFLLWT